MTHQRSKRPRPATFAGAMTRHPLTFAISSLLVGSALAGPAQAQAFPAVVKLAELDGNSGFRLDGVAQYDYSGISVSEAGDINGDGIDDLIIGAYAADPGGNGFAGSSYVVFGRDASAVGDFPSTLNLSSLDGSTGLRLDGVAVGDRVGGSVSAAGDINGDGIDDLIIGAASSSPDDNLAAGSGFVVFGRNSGFPAVLGLSTLDGTTGFRLNGVAQDDRAGTSVDFAGDINGDGIDDLIIGASEADPNGISNAGSSYVVFGRDTSAIGDFPAIINLSSLNGSTGFRLDGVSADDSSGWSVSSAGDINGDEIDDLIIGAYFADPDGNSNAGSSYTVFGRNASAVGDFPATLNLSSLNGSNGFRLDGVALGDRSGYSVSVAGDINGDGIDDLIVGAQGADANGNSSAGSSYVVFGRDVSSEDEFPAILNLASLNGSIGFRIDGVAPFDFSGVSVSGAGDVNGDGIDDLIIGSRNANPDGNSEAGSSYVVFGRDVSVEGDFPATLGLASLNGATGVRLDGVGPDDWSGFSVSGAGDINGDGTDDLIIGAFKADPNSNSAAGSSYVVFGKGDALFADRFEIQ